MKLRVNNTPDGASREEAKETTDTSSSVTQLSMENLTTPTAEVYVHEDQFPLISTEDN